MTMNQRPGSVLISALVALSAALPLAVHGQGGSAQWPAKPVTIVVNSAPGGPTDIVARAMRDGMRSKLGETVVILNRDGAIGRTGALSVARSAADGYTLLMSGAGPMLISPLTMEKMAYDAIRDFHPVNLSVEVPVIISVHPTVAKTLKELIDRAKAEPGKLSFASTGVGGPAHMVGEYLKLLSGINMFHVPYRSQPQAVVGLIGHEISMYTGTPGAVVPHGKTGALNLLAITGPQRSPLAPDVPTTAEVGFPKLGAPAFFGLFVPAGTPTDIINKIDEAARFALEQPEVGKSLASSGFTILGWGPEKFRAYLNEEMRVWGEVVKSAGIRVKADD
jgi:tripartite-type tricarboxylate transporter receptor subunit TctC